jgi:hypothetical protein
VKVLNLVVATWQLVAKYPALTAAVFQVIVLAGTQVGLHLTTTQLSSLAGTVAVVFGILVHAGVIPVTKVDNVKAGVKPDVPKGVVVAGAETNAKPVEPEGYTPTKPSPVVPSEPASGPVEADPVPVEEVPEAITTIEAKPVNILTAGGRVRDRK